MSEQPVDNNIVLTVIPLASIELNFGDNPRMSMNEKRCELKNSISSSRAEYLILEVCQKPDQVNYSLLRGGNTRLEVTRELNQEWIDADGPNPYEMIKCIVYPWRNDSEKAIMNATENLVRGKLSYAEEARAVSILKQQYLDGGITEVPFLEWSKSLGLSMSLSSTSISRYLQTAEILSPSLPKLMVVGRANTSVVNWLLNVRSRLIKIFKEREHQKVDDPNVLSREETKRIGLESTSAADNVLAVVNHQIDDLTLDRNAYSECLVNEFEQRHGLLLESERLSVGYSGSGKLSVFAKMYGIDECNEFGDDNRINAAIMVHDILDHKGYQSSNRKTRQLKKMNVNSDLAGFIQLVGMLDRKGKKLVSRLLIEM